MKTCEKGRLKPSPEAARPHVAGVKQHFTLHTHGQSKEQTAKDEPRGLDGTRGPGQGRGGPRVPPPPTHMYGSGWSLRNLPGGKRAPSNKGTRIVEGKLLHRKPSSRRSGTRLCPSGLLSEKHRVPPPRNPPKCTACICTIAVQTPPPQHTGTKFPQGHSGSAAKAPASGRDRPRFLRSGQNGRKGQKAPVTRFPEAGGRSVAHRLGAGANLQRREPLARGRDVSLGGTLCSPDCHPIWVMRVGNARWSDAESGLHP